MNDTARNVVSARAAAATHTLSDFISYENIKNLCGGKSKIFSSGTGELARAFRRGKKTLRARSKMPLPHTARSLLVPFPVVGSQLLLKVACITRTPPHFLRLRLDKMPSSQSHAKLTLGCSSFKLLLSAF